MEIDLFGFQNIPHAFRLSNRSYDCGMTDSLAIEVGRRLRAEREAQGLTLTAVAGMAGVGKGTLSEIENGTRTPNLSTLHALASALHTPTSALVIEQSTSVISTAGVTQRLLATQTLPSAVIETYHLHLEVAARFESRSLRPGSSQHILITHGRARVGPKWRPSDLEVGESATWDVRGYYGYRALGREAVDAVLVVRWIRPSVRA